MNCSSVLKIFTENHAKQIPKTDFISLVVFLSIMKKCSRHVVLGIFSCINFSRYIRYSPLDYYPLVLYGFIFLYINLIMSTMTIVTMKVSTTYFDICHFKLYFGSKGTKSTVFIVFLYNNKL